MQILALQNLHLRQLLYEDKKRWSGSEGDKNFVGALRLSGTFFY